MSLYIHKLLSPMTFHMANIVLFLSEGMRSPFVLSVLPGYFRHRLFNRYFVAASVVVVSVVAAAAMVVWNI